MKQNLYQKINVFGFIIFFVLIVMALNSCRKDYFPTVTVDVNTPVSFKNDIVPILTPNCATGAGCHNTGGENPDLTEANAYDNLMGLNPLGKLYIDTTADDASKSILYSIITASSGQMPPSGKMSADKIGKIQSWILQKAPNN